jgi:1-phosphofructokinase
MIVTLTLNPAIDKTIVVDELNTKDVTRVQSVIKDPAGKGINVAKVIHQIKEKVIATGFISGFNGSYIEDKLKQLNLDFDFIHTKGESRENLKLICRNTHETYEINEKGAVTTNEDLEMLISKLNQLIQPSDWLVISGSIPPGLDIDVYKDIIKYYLNKKVNIFLDTSGVAFSKALEAKPTVIKPNLYELEMYSHMKLDSDDKIIDQCLKLYQNGIQHVICSMGSKGTIYVGKNGIYKVTSDKIKTLFTVGAGDAFVGGFVAKFDDTNMRETLKFATATARASIKTEGTKAANLEQIKLEMKHIDIIKIKESV